MGEEKIETLAAALREVWHYSWNYKNSKRRCFNCDKPGCLARNCQQQPGNKNKPGLSPHHHCGKNWVNEHKFQTNVDGQFLLPWLKP